MKEIMYDQNSLVIAAILFASAAVAIEAGFRAGRHWYEAATEPSKTHVSAIQASLLGVLGLLLAFTFSLALQRFDSRSEAVVAESNAIGTAYLRAQLLPPSLRADVQRGLQRYVGLRAQAAAVTLDDAAEREVLLDQANVALDGLWRDALRAAEEDGRPVTTGLFIQSLNDMIDAYGTRSAAINRHVPEIVLFLLYGTFLLTSGVVGYAAGITGIRPSLATYALVLLIVVLAFVIVDLDRPRRGLITVDQSSLTDLKAGIDAAQAAGASVPGPQNLPRRVVTGRP